MGLNALALRYRNSLVRLRIADLLYDDYCFFKAGITDKQRVVMKERVINVMSPLYSEYGYLIIQLHGEKFKEDEWAKVTRVFTGCATQARNASWESGGHDERNYFRHQIDKMLNDLLAFLREQEENDVNTATSRFAVYYQDIDFVVWHEYLSKDAYRLHSYCYDMKFHIGITYEQIKEDPYRDIYGFHFYCRTEQSTTEMCFNEVWLQEWDAERFDRVQKLIRKMPGAYNQYLNPDNN